jgi:hypothetical protein
MNITAIPYIKKRITNNQIVRHNGKEYAVANIISDQRVILSESNGDYGSRRKGHPVGYAKPDITVYLIHLGKVLTRSSHYIGLNYTITHRRAVV